MTETQTSWTPGPWGYYRAISVLEGNGNFNVHSDAEPELAQTWVAQVVLREDAEANAQLIAAAPALYEALQELMDELQRARIAPLVGDKARAALAQARGKTP